VRRHAPFRVQMMETAIQLCQRGVGVMFLPHFVAHLVNRRANAEEQLATVRAPGGLAPVQLPIFLVRRRGEPESKPLRLLAQELRRLR
jgi:DNA-binding transcriptional LysR family regulator